MALASALILGTLLVRLGFAQNCYYPNGTLDDYYVPCSSGAGFTSCCAPTDECTTNGLCRPADSTGNGNDFWRNLCTDKTWQSDACPKYCYNETTSATAADGSFFVTACTWDTYCCANPSVWSSGRQYACCSSPVAVFNAGPAEWLSGPHVVTAMFPQPTTTSSSSSATSQISSQTSPPSSASTSNTAGGPTSSGDSKGKSSGSSGLTTGDKAGIGVAVGVAAVAIIVAVAACILLRRSRRRRKEAQAEVNTAWGARPAENKPVYAHYEPVAATPPHDVQSPVMAQSAPVQELGGWYRPELPGKDVHQGRPAEMES